MMFHFGILLACSYVVLAVDEDFVQKCRVFNENVLQCCNSFPKDSEDSLQPEVMECIMKFPGTTCDAEVCIAQKLGYATEGKLNMEAFTNHVETEFVKYPELLDLVRNNCLNADILNKGPSDMCDFTKMDLCILRQFVENCSEWSNEGECNESEIKDTADVCLMVE